MSSLSSAYVTETRTIDNFHAYPTISPFKGEIQRASCESLRDLTYQPPSKTGEIQPTFRKVLSQLVKERLQA
jgi:hypothetical protein